MSIRLHGGPLDGKECSPTCSWYLCIICKTDDDQPSSDTGSVRSIAAYKDGEYVRSLRYGRLTEAIKECGNNSEEDRAFEDVLEIYDSLCSTMPSENRSRHE